MKESKNSYFLNMLSLIGICLLSNMVQAYGQLDSSTLGPNAVSINATISQDHIDPSNPDWVYFDVKDFIFTISNLANLCPTDHCEYSFINNDREGFRLDGSNGRMLQGFLNVTGEGESKTFEVYGYFNVVNSSTVNNKPAQEPLNGTVQFYLGEDAMGKEYQVNGSLIWKSEKDAELALKGQL